MPQTDKNPAAHRAFADIHEVDFDAQKHSESPLLNQATSPDRAALFEHWQDCRALKVHQIHCRQNGKAADVFDGEAA